MSRFKSMTPEQRERNRIMQRIRSQRFRDNNPEKCREASRKAMAKRRQENPEHCRAIDRKADAKRYPKEKEKRIARAAKWQIENPEKVRERSAKQVANLTDSYVAARLNLPVSILRKHPLLLESHREVLNLKRKFSKPTQP